MKVIWRMAMSVTETMTQPQRAPDESRQRRAIKRTAWIVGAVAVAMYVLFFIRQGLWR